MLLPDKPAHESPADSTVQGCTADCSADELTCRDKLCLLRMESPFL